MDLLNLHRSDFDYWTMMDTRWRDMDSLNHINHATYLAYMESARVDVYIKLGYTGIRKDMDVSTILASMTVHYLSQTTHPSKLDVGHRICRVGNKSFDFVSAVFNKEDNNLLCSALFTLVAYSYKMNKSIVVPDIIKSKCRPFK